MLLQLAQVILALFLPLWLISNNVLCVNLEFCQVLIMSLRGASRAKRGISDEAIPKLLGDCFAALAMTEQRDFDKALV
jgi:hypothetical protein